MSQDPVEAFCRTARIQRSEVPSLVEELEDDEAARLTELLQSALERRHDEITTSIDDGLGMVPRPFRGSIKKILGV